MGRFIGSSINRGKGGGGGLGPTEPYDRSVGFRTDGNNNVKKIELGDFKYTDVQYNNVGLITGYNETFGGSTKGWLLSYDSQNLIDDVAERSIPHPPGPEATVTSSATNVDEGSTITITANTTNFDSGTLYWKAIGISTSSLAADFPSETGSFTITSSTGSFTLTPTEDVSVSEGAETFKVAVYSDSGHIDEIGSTPTLTINDTSVESYDYSFTNEVHYGNNGTQSYHYTGDGTMPSMSLGNPVYNWDMYFESYQTNSDQGSSSNHWVICNNGYGDNNGWLMGWYNNNVTGEVSIAHPSGGYAIYPSYALPIDQWNWVKIEWRGGSTFKLYQKSSANGSWNQRINWTSNIYNGTEWDFCSIGQGRSGTNGGFSSQFHGKIKNFRLNVNSNVSNI